MREVDVAVVGAGPAGLSAAVRARWVKSYRAVPSSVALFDPAPPGGLARMRSTRLTGPGWHLSNETLLDGLMADVRDLCIPIRQDAIVSIEWSGERWTLHGDGNSLCTARAVVLATGLRRLCNEASFFGRGLSLTYNGYDFIPGHVAQLVQPEDVRRLVVVGNAKTANLLPVFNALEGVETTFLLDEPEESPAFAGHAVHLGRPLRFEGDIALASLTCVAPGGQECSLSCDAAFIDYVAFEVKPEMSVNVAGLARNERGFVVVERDGTTNLPGLFAAGDTTGLYAMALKALSEGALAGFAAYRYVFEQKFGHAPPLFAYAAEDTPILPGHCDYPVLRASDRVVLLVGEETLRTTLDSYPQRISDMIAGEDTTVGRLAEKLGEDGAVALVHALFDAKACTVEPTREDETRHA